MFVCPADRLRIDIVLFFFLLLALLYCPHICSLCMYTHTQTYSFAPSILASRFSRDLLLLLGQFPTIRSIRQGRSNHTRVLGCKWDDVSPYTHTQHGKFFCFIIDSPTSWRIADYTTHTHTKKERKFLDQQQQLLMWNGHNNRDDDLAAAVTLFLFLLLWLLNFPGCWVILFFFFLFGHLLYYYYRRSSWPFYGFFWSSLLLATWPSWLPWACPALASHAWIISSNTSPSPVIYPPTAIQYREQNFLKINQHFVFIQRFKRRRD